VIKWNHGDEDRFFFQRAKSRIAQCIAVCRKCREVGLKRESRIAVKQIDAVMYHVAKLGKVTPLQSTHQRATAKRESEFPLQCSKQIDAG
jgi:hypothetical protein